MREEIDLLVLLWQEVIESRVEHTDDFGTLIADDLVLLLVVQRRHGEATRIGRIALEVDVAQMGVVGVDGIWRCKFLGYSLFSGYEGPSWWN